MGIFFNYNLKMPILYHDVDDYIIKLLSIDTLKNLCQTEKYFREKIRKHLIDFYDFYNKDHTFDGYTGYTTNHIIFFKAIKDGTLRLCEYLVQKYDYDINVDYNFPFKLALQYNKLDIAEWIYPTLKNKHAFSPPYLLQEKPWNYAIKSRNLEVFKWIINKYNNLNISLTKNDYEFLLIFGSLDVILYGYCTFPDIDQYITMQGFINNICIYNTIDVVKWYFEKYPNHIKNNGYDFVRTLCDNKKYDIIEWLCDSLIINRIIDERAYEFLIKNNKAETILKFLYNQNGLIHANSLFMAAINCKRINIIKYIYNNYPDKIDIKSRTILVIANATNDCNIIDYVLSLQELKKFYKFVLNESYWHFCSNNRIDLAQKLLPFIDIDNKYPLIYEPGFDNDTCKWLIDNNLIMTNYNCSYFREIITKKAYILAKHLLILWNKIDIYCLSSVNVVEICKNDIELAILLTKCDKNFRVIIDENNKITSYYVIQHI